VRGGEERWRREAGGGRGLARNAWHYLDRHCFGPIAPRENTRPVAQHHQPPRTLHDLALVERAHRVEAIIAVDHDLDAAAFAAIAEQRDRGKSDPTEQDYPNVSPGPTPWLQERLMRRLELLRQRPVSKAIAVVGRAPTPFAKLIEGRTARSLPILIRRMLSWKNLTSAPDLNSGVSLTH
jgi:hypothetical protein